MEEKIMGVIYIMWLRQLKRYWRSKSRMIGTLGQPVLFLIALGFGFGAIYQKAGGGNYLEFLAPGIVAMSILFTSMFNGIEVIWDRQFGFLKETLVAPVSRIKIMIGRTLGGATVAFFQGTLVLLISIIIGFRIISFSDIFLTFMFMFLIALLFTALGTAIASKMQDMNAFPLIINFLIMPLFFLSGALFPLNDLPGVLATIVKINPLSYGVDGIRGALTNLSSFGLFFDFAVLGILTLIVGLIGSYLFSKIEV
jgi:ABC-2 type transport system permease protein